MSHGRAEEISFAGCRHRLFKNIWICLVPYKLFINHVLILETHHVLNVLQVKGTEDFHQDQAPLATTATTANDSMYCIVTFHAIDILCRASKILMILSFSHFRPVNHVKHGLKDDPPKTGDKKTAWTFGPGILNDGRFAKRGPSAVGRLRPLLASKLDSQRLFRRKVQQSNSPTHTIPRGSMYIYLHLHLSYTIKIEINQMKVNKFHE